jgi:pantothenate kinase
LLDQIAGANHASAVEMRETLAADRAQQRRDVAAMVVAIRSLLSEMDSANSQAAADLHACLSSDKQARAAATAGFMANTTASRQATAEALADRLEQFRAALQSDVSDTLAAFAGARGELSRSLSEMAKAWRDLTTMMRESAGQTQPNPPVPAVAQPVAVGADATSGILSYLADHSEGAKLVELMPMFDLARPQMGRLLHNLVDSGKVVKDPETLVYRSV